MNNPGEQNATNISENITVQNWKSGPNSSAPNFTKSEPMFGPKLKAQEAAHQVMAKDAI